MLEVGGSVASDAMQTDTSKPRQVTATADSQGDGNVGSERNKHAQGEGAEEEGTPVGQIRGICDT